MSSANGAELPNASLRSCAAALEACAELLHPHLEGVARARVEGAEDLVELDGRRHLRRPAAARPRGASRRSGARRQLDVRLAQQRLLAQDRRVSLGIGAYSASSSIVASERARRPVGVDRS